jgi:hypothetical protein
VTRSGHSDVGGTHDCLFSIPESKVTQDVDDSQP